MALLPHHFILPLPLLFTLTFSDHIPLLSQLDWNGVNWGERGAAWMVPQQSTQNIFTYFTSKKTFSHKLNGMINRTMMTLHQTKRKKCCKRKRHISGLHCLYHPDLANNLCKLDFSIFGQRQFTSAPSYKPFLLNHELGRAIISLTCNQFQKTQSTLV